MTAATAVRRFALNMDVSNLLVHGGRGCRRAFDLRAHRSAAPPRDLSVVNFMVRSCGVEVALGAVLRADLD
jgi:hypothetical protein